MKQSLFNYCLFTAALLSFSGVGFSMPPAPDGPYQSLEDVLSAQESRAGRAIETTAPMLPEQKWMPTESPGLPPRHPENNQLNIPMSEWSWGAPSTGQPLLHREPAYPQGTVIANPNDSGSQRYQDSPRY